ncbi:MAG TPA: aldehyde ferredoxin oxidoreductase C-terminal domain-containing protein [bacterium]|nr:aldehyde ferredoxin oxidoreductase C-terminal domain-containing protein [bacterium]
MIIRLNDARVEIALHEQSEWYGKALAARRVMKAENPDATIYLSGFTPLAASGLGFAGKLNIYGTSLLGNNLQGSRSGGLITRNLTRMGILGIQVEGQTSCPTVLHLAQDGSPHLIPLSEYGEDLRGTHRFAQAIYKKHGKNIGLAITDPASTGFFFNAIACNAQPGEPPHRVAGRGTTRFGQNGLVGVVVERTPAPLHGISFNKKDMAEILRKLHQTKWNKNLTGSDDLQNPSLGGTYGSAAKGRFDAGHGLTNLFRSAHIPDEYYQTVLPENIVRDQLRLAAENDLAISRHSCLPGCPNKCSQTIIMYDDGEYKIFKAGEWETYQGAINLGIFEQAVPFTTWVTHHSNDFAYDHIEGLVTLAALALVTESKVDTGVRYGDAESMKRCLREAVAGETDLGQLFRRGAAAVEQHYGLERHFTVGGHALAFHNGRSMVQTGVGLSWTYGRHGECCAGPGRLNFLGLPYNPADHTLDARTHVLNSVHGMIMYGAVDEHGMCFFIGPSLDTLVDGEMILNTMGLPGDAREMIRRSAELILQIHEFNDRRGVRIQPLPRTFYDQPTRGNRQTDAEAVAFNVPFAEVRDYGREVFAAVASGRMTVPDELLAKSRSRYQ